jgi:exopolysaccharide biosynthesis polyprenyl glycosylphosphotransferase
VPALIRQPTPWKGQEGSRPGWAQRPSQRWLRTALAFADVLSLFLAFLGADGFLATRGDQAPAFGQSLLLFVVTLPAWILGAKLYGLYDRDDDRVGYSTVDDFVSVVHLVTVGVFVFLFTSWATALPALDPPQLLLFWAIAIPLALFARALVRAYSHARRRPRQSTVIVGAGEVGQLIGRKFLRHPEYGIDVVGFVDAAPRERPPDLHQIRVLGTPDELPDIVRRLQVDRVVIAFSIDASERIIDLVRSLRRLRVHVDLVPRLFEVVGPTATIHSVEGVPMVGLPPVRFSRPARVIKRTIDVLCAATALVLVAPLFAFLAWRIRRDSPGPVFFRQRRLGMDMREFTMLKFRTMRTDTDDTLHRAYIKQLMSRSVASGPNSIYKLKQDDAVTGVGGWLRTTSLDELPQLINVLRGEMSLVGPRPCIRYEVDNYAPRHFDRFLVPAGLTGLWQVEARGRATYLDALEMDVAYACGWSLALDLRLLWRTAFAVLRRNGTR